MLRSEQVRLDATPRQAQELRLLGDRASRLWNAANYACRQAFLAKTGVPAGYALIERMKATPEYRQLPSDMAQEVLKKLAEAWKSYWALRSAWTKDPVKNQKPGFPKYRKDRKTGERPYDLIPVKHPRSYAVDPKDCHIVLPRDRRRKPGARLHIAYRGRRRFTGKMGRAEVTYDRVRKRWYFGWAVTIEEKDRPAKMPGERCASIDLGVRIAASLSIEDLAQALHFENREVLKDWDFLGHEIALEQQAIAGTRGKVREDRAPSSLAIARLHQKRRLRAEHAMKAMAKAIAGHCVANGVSKAYLGHPKGILRDVSYGSSLWAGRIHNFWSFDKLLGYIQAALETVGIEGVRAGERGSSSTCSSCGSRNVVRHPRWSIRCKNCSKRIHSDQSGSRMILKSQKPSVCWDGAQAAPLTGTMRWTDHRWDPRSANPGRLIQAGRPEFLQTA